MPGLQDGPSSPLFTPLLIQGNATRPMLPTAGISPEMADALPYAPSGSCTSWGIPFWIDSLVLLADEPVTVALGAVVAPWLIFLHTSDLRRLNADAAGLVSPMSGRGHLNEHAADYVIGYEDGSEERVAIRRRHELGAFQRGWGENCFQAVSHRKPHPLRGGQEQMAADWGRSQTRVTAADGGTWVNWLYAWQNPHPDKAIASVRLEPVSGLVIVSAISAGRVSSFPLRWQSRRKAVLRLPEGTAFRPDLDENGLLQQIRLDMGQVISATPRPIYPDASWSETYNNRVPEISANEVLLEYTAHEEALFHFEGGMVFPLSSLDTATVADPLRPVSPAQQRVTLRVVDRSSGKPVPVKLHVHGQAGEYLAPVDRHRIPNAAWFQDYSVDFTHLNTHHCVYIPGETDIDLPLGQVYIEISKGFEIRPLRKVIEVTQATRQVTVEIDRVLPWREKGWVTADTHVHFLSTQSALLEGAGEGVNVVNLLASQWGELMTNVGDFDGKTTFGSREAGGDGEYLVRVGTENRQHILGHISLLGYEGRIIAPMTTGGPDESAIGDPIEILLTEWARQCKAQGGVVILPHFPNPRAEHAASIVSGVIDGVEMTAWGNLYGGIDPYSLSDWYRYLNCGYLVAAVGGTDKMTSITAVGTVRTYARTDTARPFDYDAWKEAIRRGETFVTYGPLLEFTVEGKPMGSRMKMLPSGGTVDIEWEVASITVPMSRVELVINGEIRESQVVAPDQAAGHWSVRLDKSSWLALLVRGHYEDKPEIVAAHSSPVMVELEGSPFFAAADAVTILEQIEGALAYLDTVGTRADDAAYKRMRLVLTSAHRNLHNRMHQQGQFHDHTPMDDHAAHH